MSDKPNWRDPKVIIRAVDDLLPSVLQWMENTDGESGEDDDAARRDIEEALVACLAESSWDGYHLAKWLARERCWAPDADLVEILHRAFIHRYRFLEAKP